MNDNGGLTPEERQRVVSETREIVREALAAHSIPDDHATATSAADAKGAVVIDAAGRLVGSNPREEQDMTDRDQAPQQSLLPGRADFGRAAAICLHAYDHDPHGVNALLAEADLEGRMSALVLALIEMGKTPDAWNSPTGIAGLRNVALAMSLDPEPPAPDQ